MFPSPTGESHFLITSGEMYTKIWEGGFPSPTGESHFLMKKVTPPGWLVWSVSVPYRGITFLNLRHTIRNQKTLFPSPTGESHFLIYNKRWKVWNDCVSVPYRGITFLNIKIKNPKIRKSKVGFRPLPGNHIS